MYLHRALYYCENKIKELGLPVVKEIKTIIAAGLKNNVSAGITGGLIFNEQYFVGVLEGDRRRVSVMLSKIMRDKRAANMVILQAGAIQERLFDDWPVVYAGHSDEIDRAYIRYGLTIGLDPGRASAETMLGLVRTLTRIEGASMSRETPAGVSAAAAPREAPAAAEAQEVIRIQPPIAPAAGRAMDLAR